MNSERFFYDEINASVVGCKLLRWSCGPWVETPAVDNQPKVIQEVRLDGCYARVRQSLMVDIFVAPGGWIEIEL